MGRRIRSVCCMHCLGLKPYGRSSSSSAARLRLEGCGGSWGFVIVVRSSVQAQEEEEEEDMDSWLLPTHCSPPPPPPPPPSSSSNTNAGTSSTSTSSSSKVDSPVRVRESRPPTSKIAQKGANSFARWPRGIGYVAAFLVCHIPFSLSPSPSTPPSLWVRYPSGTAFRTRIPTERRELWIAVGSDGCSG